MTRSFSRAGLRCACLCLATTYAGCTAPSPDPPAESPAGFDFAVVGDTPYSPEAERLFPRLAEAVAGAPVDFVIHVGDVKGSSVPCTDSLLTQRIEALDAFGHPVVYVPGDNEWTDCHRRPPGVHAPLERLAFLRTLAYPEPGRTLGTPPMRVRSQADHGRPEFPEHQRWSRRGIVFATIHMVGSLNGLAPFATRTADDDAEVGRRIEAAVAWIHDTFREARETGAVGVVVATQANPWTVPPGLDGPNGFDEVVDALRREAEAFPGPVLLVHGDSHTFRLDRPLWSEEVPAVPNLYRLETYGAPDVGWVQVHVDPAGTLPFTVTPHPVGP